MRRYTTLDQERSQSSIFIESFENTNLLVNFVIIEKIDLPRFESITWRDRYKGISHLDPVKV